MCTNDISAPTTTSDLALALEYHYHAFFLKTLRLFFKDFNPQSPGGIRLQPKDPAMVSGIIRLQSFVSQLHTISPVSVCMSA